MIVKVVPAKKATKSSYKALANYILDIKNDMKKVESYFFTNCSFTETENNILEIENTQALNQRAKQDKTYHLIVSFQEDENPSDELIGEIEEEFMKAIGLENCQRLSAIHNNTKNKHIHIAVNRIDPLTYKFIDKFQDMPILQKKAEEIEIKYNLKKDNHITQDKQKSNNKKQENDYTVHTGMINFKEWVKVNVKDDIKKILNDKTSTWSDINRTLAKYDLSLRERGNGYVITSNSQKLFIKASDVHRELSKAKIEQRYGKQDKELLKAIIEEVNPIKKFGKETTLKSSLWEEYREIERKKERVKIVLQREEKATREKEYLLLNEKYRLRRENLKKNRAISKIEKKKLYNSLKLSREKEFLNARTKFKEQRDTIFKDYKKQSFKDFLITRAMSGNEKALDSLRRGKPLKKEDDNTLSALGENKDNKIFLFGDKMVNKDGTITYNINDDSKVFDKGTFIKVDIRDNKEDEILTILKMAIAKYGNELDITGTEQFKKEVLKTVQKHSLDISFKDSTMQDINKANNEAILNEKTKKAIADITKTYLSKELKTKEELEEKIKSLEEDNIIKIDTKIKKEQKNNELNIIRLHKLFKKTQTGATIYGGDLKKIGMEYKDIDRMKTFEVDIKVDGFIKKDNLEALDKMNKEILSKMKKEEDITRFNKFLYVFNKTDKIKDMTLSFYDNRKIDTKKYIKDFNMEVTKLDKKANAIKLSDKTNSQYIINYANTTIQSNEKDKTRVDKFLEDMKVKEDLKKQKGILI